MTIESTYEIVRAYNNKSRTLAEIHDAYKELINNRPDDDYRIFIWQVACEFADDEMIDYFIHELGWTAANTFLDSHSLLHILANRGQANYFDMPEGRIYRSVCHLLDAKVSTLRKDSANMTALMISAREGMSELLQAYIDKNIKIGGITTEGNSLLHLVSEYSGRAEQSFVYTQKQYDQEMAKVDYDQNQSYMKERRDRVLSDYNRSIKRQQDFLNYAKLLLKHGLDPYEKNNYGKSAIDVAVEYKAKKMGALLTGVDIDSSATKLQMQAAGMTIYQACINQDNYALSAILQLGTDPNAAYDDPNDRFNGLLPLAICIILKNLQGVNLLLQYGASATLLDAKGCHPLRYYYHIQSQLNVNNNIFKNKIIPQTIDAFIQSGFDINSYIDDDENTLLNISAIKFHSLTKYNDTSIAHTLVETLVFKNADINKSNQAGITPLMSLCKSDDRTTENFIILLLENGADVNAKDNVGGTPLIYTAKNKNGAMAKTFAEILSQFGDIQIQAKDNNGKSALDYAVENNHEPLVNWLLTAQ